ncbi:MAG: IS3 family transposase [Thermoleophilia bacterium]
MFLADQIVQVHRDSAGIYDAHRVTAELRRRRRIAVGHNAVAQIMRELGLKGLPNRRMPKHARIGHDLLPGPRRPRLAHAAPDELWMTDITEHPPVKARSTAAQ